MPESLETSFTSLFELEFDGSLVVGQVEIPLIQRDYAQGRRDAATSVIRDNFLRVLHAAATGSEPVGLDFVYGEVTGGTLQPLDGQQRLTALFLLHWYVAARTERIEGAGPWTKFTYATRPSARLFCERLVKTDLPQGTACPSCWITDQPWYLSTWRHDPTVQSMLVVLDDLHRLFEAEDLEAVWARLIDAQAPAISFHLLPVEDMGSAEDLYIKMNSRGRPLTEFENFKARLEKMLDGSPRANDFAQRVDGAWSDLLWPMHGGDNLVDDEFLRYIEFVIEICEWRQDDTKSRRERLIVRAERALATGEPEAADNLDLLFHAFDTWVSEPDPPGFFEGLFATELATPDGNPKLVIFGQNVRVDLLEACCRDFGNEQRFGTTRKLLLYAVLLHRIHVVDDFRSRIRKLRNLLEASEDELRADKMPGVLDDLHPVIIDGDVESVGVLNQVQRSDELEKEAFLQAHPDLRATVCRLEDNELLRGSLVAFDLDYERLAQRSEAFEQALSTPELAHAFTGALLASGEYHRKVKASLQFGAPESSRRWRDLLTGATRTDMRATRVVLAQVLDVLSTSDEDARLSLEAVVTEFIEQAQQTERFDWRYYLVRHPVMRIGKSGIYRTPDGTMGYSICMLERTQMNSRYRDPFLLAVVREADAQESVVDGEDGPWFTGAATNERWLRTRNSDLRMRCVDSGFTIRNPPEPGHQLALAGVLESRHDIRETEEGYRLVIPQVDVDGRQHDTVDRIMVGADFLAAAVDAGL